MLPKKSSQATNLRFDGLVLDLQRGDLGLLQLDDGLHLCHLQERSSLASSQRFRGFRGLGGLGFRV